MKGKLKIVHQVPGRIRMKIPSAKGNQEQLEQYKEILTVIPGVRDIEVNASTGNIILKYDADHHATFQTGFNDRLAGQHGQPRTPRPPTNEIDAFANKIAEEAEFLSRHSEAARVVVDFCRKADREIKLATHNVLDLKMLLAIGVVGFTVLEVGAAAATPVWVTLALFGLNHFIEMQTSEPESQEADAPSPVPA